MVHGMVIFAVEGRLPLFSAFFTPEGNDERMQARQQAIIRRVYDDYILRMQYTRDVILAKPAQLPASLLREAGQRRYGYSGIDRRSSSSSSSSGSSGSSSSSSGSSSASHDSSNGGGQRSNSSRSSSSSSGEKRNDDAQGRKREEAADAAGGLLYASSSCTTTGGRLPSTAAPVATPATATLPTTAAAATAAPIPTALATDYGGGIAATVGAVNAAAAAAPAAAAAGAAAGAIVGAGRSISPTGAGGGTPVSWATHMGHMMIDDDTRDEYPWDKVFPPPPSQAFPAHGEWRGGTRSSRTAGTIAAAGDPADAPFASAVPPAAAATATAAAASEMTDGLLHVTSSSLFPSSARLIIWKHVEGVCYSALCGAMENVALVLNFLSLFVHCLDEAFSLSFPSSPLPLKQQLLTRPDIVLLVLHMLLPGGQLLLINRSYSTFLKKKIRASLGLGGSPSRGDGAGGDKMGGRVSAV